MEFFSVFIQDVIILFFIVQRIVVGAAVGIVFGTIVRTGRRFAGT